MQTSGAQRFMAVLRGELVLAALLFAWSIRKLIWSTRAHGDDFADMATGQFLGMVVGYQLRVIPAYLLVALAYALVLFPFLHRRPLVERVASKQGGRLQLLALVAASSVVLGLLSAGPFFRQSPGLLDGMARKVGAGFDWYALHDWHVLDALSVVFAGVCLYAFGFYAIRWWRARAVDSPARRVLWLAPLAVLIAGAAYAVRSASPPPPPADTPPNVLIIASDSLRYDRLGVHGHDRDVSPNIDAFAKDAVDFTQMHVATASTLESWLTVLSSQFPPNHGVRYMYLRKEQAEAAGQTPDLLTRILNAHDYATIAVSNWAGNCFKLVDVGFEHNLVSDTQNFDAFIMETTIWTHLIFPLYFSNPIGEALLPEATRTTKYLRPGVLVDKMFGQIDDATRAGKPFFGLLFFSTTHLPYTASYPFNVRYTDPDYTGPHRYEIEVTVHDLITTGFDPDLPPDTVQHIRDLYDGTVAEFDHYVGQTLARLEARGLMENTIVIVTSDHGEDLYDPGSTLGHGTNFFGGDQSTRIPFFVRAPGVSKPGVVDTLARNVDFAPTILDLLKIPAPEGWQGVSLTGGLTGAGAPDDLPVFGETCYLFFPKSKALIDLTADERARVLDSSDARKTLKIDTSFNNNMVLRADLHDTVIQTKDRMVRTPRWKLIHIPGRDGPIYRLYDMKADPGQTRNLADQGLAVMPRLVEMMDAYWRGDAGDQRWPAALDELPGDNAASPE